MAGGFVFVVGPSGAGKDTLIGRAKEALAGDPRYDFPRRLVTRESSVWEDHDTIGAAEFAAGEAADRFALSWRAHGLGYALPAGTREAAERGLVVVCNISRRAVEAARNRLPTLGVVEVTASAAVRAERLRARGRAEDSDVGARLAREAGDCRPDLVIVNDGAPEEGARELVAFLRRAGRS